MTASVEDVSSLPGKKVSDQEEVPIGEVTEIYAMEDDGHPMWVAVDASFGLGEKRKVLIPLARLKEEDGELRVPYSKQHIGKTPEVEDGEGISAELDSKLRAHYGIDRGDQELREDNKSYATLVPEQQGEAERVEDAGQLETPSADKRTDETQQRLEDPGSDEIRHIDAGEIADQSTERDGSSDSAPSEDEVGEYNEGQDEDGED